MPRRRRRIEKWLAESVTPIFVLDADRAMAWFNHGCETLTGWAADDVVGWRCDYSSEFEPGTVDALVASLSPPPDLDPHTLVPVQVACRDGQLLTQLLRVSPLATDDGAADGFVGVLLPPRPGRSAPPDDSPTHRLHAELAALRHSIRQRHGITNLVGDGPAMRRVLQQVQLASETSVGVSVLGEEGTGREHVARTIHFASAAGHHSFVPVDAARLSPGELKGMIDRVLGSPRSGSAEVLKPGALFLADIDLVPRDVQSRLLERLQALPVDDPDSGIRLMASSTQALEQAVASEQLLPELHFLVSTITIPVPSLRDRLDDFRLLVQHFLEHHNHAASFQVGGVSETTWDVLGEYDWPGNISELHRVITEAAASAAERLSAHIEPSDLPFAFRTGIDAQQAGGNWNQPIEPIESVLERVEREHIGMAMQRARGNKAEAARLLGLTRPRLYRRLEQLDMLDTNFTSWPTESPASD